MATPLSPPLPPHIEACYKAPATAAGSVCAAPACGSTCEDLVQTQAEMISSLRTQLAAMTALMQQGVRVPLDEALLDGQVSHVRVAFDSRWRWEFE